MVSALGCIEMHPHKKEPRLIITKLRRVQNVAARIRQKLGDPKDNAFGIGARQGEDKVVMHMLAGLAQADHGLKKNVLTRRGG
jgi:hypothetical protein